MKKLLPITLLLLSLLFVSAGSGYVYICTGKNAYAYHSKKNCQGIKNCKSEIKTVTFQYATQELKRKPCGYCYK